MEDKKFERYYFLINCYSDEIISKINDLSDGKGKDVYDDDEIESGDIAFFRYDSPIDIRILMKYLRFIIMQMYLDLGSRENVEKAVEEIKNGKINNEKKYKWKDIYLEDLFNADFYYLKKIFILKNDRNDLIPDENSFLIKYSRPDYDYTWPFSLKELYYYFLTKGIEIFINNFDNNKKN